MSKALLVRALAAAAVALPLVGAAATPAAADHPVPVTEFFADHSRTACDYAHTEGSIAWNPAHPGERQRVDVAGVLVDRPVSICQRPPAGSPFAEFTAYVRGTEVDHKTVSGNELVDASGRFRFSLFNTTGLPSLPIDRVDVRVCRDFGPMLPAFSCGDVESYRPPQIGPAD